MKVFSKRLPALSASVAFVVAILSPVTTAANAAVVRRDPPFDYRNHATLIHYPSALPATKPWILCIAFPHIKDAYWLSVNYGMVEEARRLGVEVRFLEAGGYLNLQRQRDQVKECAAMADVDALIIGTISFDGLSDLVKEISRKMPVLATVNDIANADIAGKVGVSWYDMGRLIGEYLVARHPVAGAPIPIVWFPGPHDAGWVPFVDRGFREAIRHSRITIATTAWGDTDKAVQRNLVQNALDKYPKVRYLVGNALMAEAAISVLRERGIQDKTAIISTYFTPGVYRGIIRGRILAAPSDSPVLQGRLSIGQAVNLLEERSYIKHLGPAIKMVDAATLKNIHLEDDMTPSTFSPQFSYVPK